MSREITKRETLLEAVDMMRKIRNSYAQDELGMIPIEKKRLDYEEYEQKVRILMDMVRALEAEPVKRALAQWQIDIMEGGTDGHQGEDWIDYPEEQRVSGGDGAWIEGSEMEHQPV